MARGIEGNEIATPKPTLKKSTSSASASASQKGQRTILGFFQKKGGAGPASSSPAAPSTVRPSPATATRKPGLTPAPSSDAGAPSSPPLPSSPILKANSGKNKENGLPSPASSTPDLDADAVGRQEGPEPASSPPRKVYRYIYPRDLLKSDPS